MNLEGKNKKNTGSDVSIVLCGGAGKGIQTVEQLITRMLKQSGYHVFATKEYMSRVRGGSNSTQIRVSDRPVRAPLHRIDLLIPLDEEAISHVSKRFDEKTIVIGDKVKLNTKNKVINVSFEKIAKKIGNAIYSNTVAVGLMLGILEGDLDAGKQYLKKYFSSKNKEEVITDNIKALEKGYQEALDLLKKVSIDSNRFHNLKKSKRIKNSLLINGAESIGFGAIAGECNFISSYPMSPSTGVLVFLSQHASEFNIISEQAEDEIAAINMALGAWYAGARAMVTTSGGGLALMYEGISLAGMMESPIVVHLAQRPGPATGLPTRTEQGDLNLALYSGHGEFPRIILAPGQIEEAYQLTQKAFYWADKFQVPVFILTDQYTMDTYYDVKEFEVPKAEIEKFLVETDSEYKRFSFNNDDGISPRGIPGFGDGLVKLDSDEHNEEGLITEDVDIRISMVEKRNDKLKKIAEEAFVPTLVGPKDYDTLCIGWGSTYHIIKEALELLDYSNIALLHFKQVYPISDKSMNYLEKAKQVVSIENNYNGQFSQLLENLTGIEIDTKILKYNGLPFFVDELSEEIKDIVSNKKGGKNEKD